jgi:DNA polymerase-3 subunit alpha
LAECKKLKIKILKPDINKSNKQFKLVKGKIMHPLNSVKGVGDKAWEAISAARQEGKFKSFQDFMNRVNKTTVNVNIVSKLILAGCFRNLEESVEETFDDYISSRSKENVYRQVYCKDCKLRFPCTVKHGEKDSAFCPSCAGSEIIFDLEGCKGKKFSESYIATHVYGFTFGGNSLKQYVNEISKHKAEPLSVLEEVEDSVRVNVAIFVENIKKWKDKNGNEMAFVDVSDGEYKCSLTIFASDWEELQKEVQVGCCYILKANKNRGNNLLFTTRGKPKSKLIRLGI